MGAASQHVVITGGSSGIGQAIAQRLASTGAHISIIARDSLKLSAAQADIEQHCLTSAQQVLTFVADVSDQTQATSAIQGAIAQLGAPDWLITCAGVAHPGYFQDLPVEVFERTMAINYFGTLYCIRAALSSMQQRQQGRIVLVSSGAGLVGLYGYTPYSPTKFALRGLAESLRGELKPLGIGVSVVYPPDTDTPQLIQENQTKPPETQRITATAKLWTAGQVADEILKGLRQQQFAIAPGTEMSILHRWHSLIAPVLNWYFDRIVAQIRTDRNR